MATPRVPLAGEPMFDRVEIVELLIGRGAHPDARDADGCTALSYATRMGAHNAAGLLAGKD